MDQHHDPAAGETEADPAGSRRHFLRRAGTAAVAIGGAAVPLAGFTSTAGAQEPDDEADPDGDSAPEGDPGAEGNGAAGPEGCDVEPVDMPEGDEQTVAFAESVERAAVEIYELVLAQRLLSPPAEEAARGYTSNHSDHAEALRCLMGSEAAGDPDASLLDEFTPQIGQAEEENELIELLRTLEDSMAAMYLQALGEVETADVAGVLATIMPVDCQQAVAWSLRLEMSLEQFVPAFQTTEGAITPAGEAA